MDQPILAATMSRLLAEYTGIKGAGWEHLAAMLVLAFHHGGKISQLAVAS